MEIYVMCPKSYILCLPKDKKKLIYTFTQTNEEQSQG